MAYNCWEAPILWQSSQIYSPDLPNPGVKSFTILTVVGGVNVIAGKTYRITVHTTSTGTGAPSNWEEWNGDEWVENPSIASIKWWRHLVSQYPGGSGYYGCNFGAGSDSWSSLSGDFAFRIYDNGDNIKESNENENGYYGACQLWNAHSQTFTPSENYTIGKVAVMLCEYDAYRRGYLIVKIQRVTVGDPGYVWIEGDDLAYTDSDGLKRLETGTLDGATGVTPGYIWIEGTKLRYIDSSGNERYIEGTAGGSGTTPGYWWIEANDFHYIDANGDERYFTGTLS